MFEFGGGKVFFISLSNTGTSLAGVGDLWSGLDSWQAEERLLLLQECSRREEYLADNGLACLYELYCHLCTCFALNAAAYAADVRREAVFHIWGDRSAGLCRPANIYAAVTSLALCTTTARTAGMAIL